MYKRKIVFAFEFLTYNETIYLICTIIARSTNAIIVIF